MSSISKFALMLNFLLAFCVPITVFAQGSDPTSVPTPSDDEVNRIAKNMYCPVCENVPLDVCETQACADWREEIRLRLSEGWSDQQIYDYFVERHGDRVLAIPPARGLNWLVYIVPPVVLLGGVILLYRVLRAALGAGALAATPKNAAHKTASAPSDDEYVTRLEDELKKRQ